jgi:FkbM family methyltransferase
VDRVSKNSKPGSGSGTAAAVARRWKDALIRLALAVLPLYFKYFPLQRGKVFVWKRIVMRRLIRRRMTLVATSWFGARFEVCFPDILQTYLYFFGVWEPVISKYLFDRLGDGDIFIDIGANVGYHTLLASSRVGANGKVFAIEAASSTYAKLQQNLSQNKAGNVTTFHVAVSDIAGQVPVWASHKGDSPGTTTLSHVAEKRETLTLVETVEAKPLQQIIDVDTICKARFIKIDVEGAEWAVVKSLAGLMKEISPRTEFIVEVDDALVRHSGGTVKAFLNYFAAAGFEPFVIANRYDAGFFASKVRRTELQRFDGRKFGQIDLVFRRCGS